MNHTSYITPEACVILLYSFIILATAVVFAVTDHSTTHSLTHAPTHSTTGSDPTSKDHVTNSFCVSTAVTSSATATATATASSDDTDVIVSLRQQKWRWLHITCCIISSATILLPHMLLSIKAYRFQCATAFAILCFTVIARAQSCGEGGDENTSPMHSLPSRIWKEILQLLFFNTQNLVVVNPVTPRIVSSLGHLLKIILIAFVLDTSVYLGNDFVSDIISKESHTDSMLKVWVMLYWQSILAGITVLAALELLYLCGSFHMHMCRCELPDRLMHNHPLVSTSLREFWSMRWNPLVNNLFKVGIYLPLRRSGYSSAVGILTSFSSSALLHCIPVLIGEFPGHYRCSKICLFFVLHGVLVYTSRVYSTVLEYTNNGGKSIVSRNSEQCISRSNSLSVDFAHWIAEAGICVTVLCGLYGVVLKMELHENWKSDRYDFSCSTLYFTTAMLAFTTSCWCMFYEVIPYTYRMDTGVCKQAILAQWLTTIFIIMVTVPLFSEPIIFMFDEAYSSSMFVGKLMDELSSIISRNKL